MSNTAMEDYAALLGGEVEEVGGLADGEFPPTWEFRDDPLLAGRYAGVRSVKTENGPRNIHSFKDAAVGTDPKALIPVSGGDMDAWGTTVLDDVLDKIAKGQKALVVYEGQKETGRRPHIFRAYQVKGVTA